MTTRGYETKIITEIRRLFLYFGRESFIIPPCKHAYQNPHSKACAHGITCLRMLEFAQCLRMLEFAQCFALPASKSMCSEHYVTQQARDR